MTNFTTCHIDVNFKKVLSFYRSDDREVLIILHLCLRFVFELCKCDKSTPEGSSEDETFPTVSITIYCKLDYVTKKSFV